MVCSHIAIALCINTMAKSLENHITCRFNCSCHYSWMGRAECFTG